MGRWRIALAAAIVLVTASVVTVWLLRREGLADLSRDTVPVTLAVASRSFADDGRMPGRVTCGGGNSSPDIELPQAPFGTRSWVIMMDDLDAPIGFVHWLVYDIPAGERAIGEGASAAWVSRSRFAEGSNGFGHVRYDGPCPPGGRHRYRVSAYAIDLVPGLAPGETKTRLMSALSGHILARGQILGVYERTKP